MNKFKILATCSKGVAPYLNKEMESLGFNTDEETPAGVFTYGDMTDALRLNLMLRTAHRVLLLIKHFRAGDGDELYRQLCKIEWENYIDENEFLTVVSNVDNPSIRDTRYASLKCKDAIVDRIRGISGRRPDSGSGKSGVVVSLYWKGDRCAVYLDSTGEPLSKRGYKRLQVAAPMQETLAASLIAASGWDPLSNFVNPMCGSGTIAIEAALISINKSPGTLRNNFGFMHIKGYDPLVWSQLKKEAEMRLRAPAAKIIATDISTEAVNAARRNAATAGVEDIIDFSVENFSNTLMPAGGGTVMLNPEYGERMGKVRELESVYKEIGDYFKKKCLGYTGYVFTGNPELAKKVGLRTKKKMIFYNGSIECRLLAYETYEGSRQAKYDIIT